MGTIVTEKNGRIWYKTPKIIRKKIASSRSEELRRAKVFFVPPRGAQRESAVTISISVCAVASMLRKALPIDPMMHCHGLDRRQCIRQERLLGAQGRARSLEGREGSKAGSDGQGRQGGVILSSGSSKSYPCRMRRRPPASRAPRPSIGRESRSPNSGSPRRCG